MFTWKNKASSIHFQMQIQSGFGVAFYTEMIPKIAVEMVFKNASPHFSKKTTGSWSLSIMAGFTDIRWPWWPYTWMYNICMSFYPVHCAKLTLIRPTRSAYPYHLVLLIWYSYSIVFLTWYPYALTSWYGNTAHCSGYDAAIDCYVLFIVTRTPILTSQWYDRSCFMEYARADVSETPDNALTTRMHGDYRLLIDCWIQCHLLRISEK